MIFIKRVPREEMDQRHARARAKSPEAQAPKPRVLNQRAILDLGNLTFFTFQGRAYGVPPLPYKAGQRLQKLWAEAAGFGTLDQATLPRYNEIVNSFPPILWGLCRPCGRIRRLLRRLGLLRNPFLRASDGEIIALVAFFLNARTKSSVQSLQEAPQFGPRIS